VLVRVDGYAVRKPQEFLDWVTTNEDRIRRAYEPFGQYLGTFQMIYSSDFALGNYFTCYAVADHAAFDRMTQDVRDGGPLAEIERELSDLGIGAISRFLVRDVASVPRHEDLPE
jgi:hypothetical protein